MNRPPLSHASLRPWAVQTGYDGGQTGVVSFDGYMVADCEPQAAQGGLLRTAEANAILICEAVNRYKARDPILHKPLPRLTEADLRSALDGWADDLERVAAFLNNLLEQRAAEEAAPHVQEAQEAPPKPIRPGD